MAQPQEFPFNIMDVAELLHLHIRRRQADSVYADCPICGDKRGKMNINFAKNLWRCNYCNEGGGTTTPSVADDVYDYMYDELLALEEHTGVCMANSPTQTVGYPVVSALPKVAHDIPLLSLDT